LVVNDINHLFHDFPIPPGKGIPDGEHLSRRTFLKQRARHDSVHDSRTPGERRRLRQKTLRIALRLEHFLGVPRQAKKLPGPLTMLIATILSQNTNDRNSHRAYAELKRRFPSWKKLADAPVGSIADAIRSGGMANQKSTRIRHTVRFVKRRFGSHSLKSIRRMSDDQVITELTALDGVGFKTASCVLLFSLGRDVFPVDTHVHRLCTRLGLNGLSRTPDDTYHSMKEIVPKGRGYSFHTNLIRFGRLICRSNNPLCGACPLFAACRYPEKERSRTMNMERDRPGVNFMLLDNIRK
jgi:endonuclease-3